MWSLIGGAIWRLEQRSGVAGLGECVSGEKMGVSAGGADEMDANGGTGEGNTRVVEGDGEGFGSI